MDIIEERIRLLNPWWVKNYVFPPSIRRDILDKLLKLMDTAHIKDIMGVRRCGKTTLLLQLIENIISQGEPGKKILFLNFDDPVLNINEFNKIMSIANQISPEFEYLFVDEIQEKKDWARWIRIFYDQKKFKQIYITGSNSSLLREDIGRVLTGRHISFYLYPFSFREYLMYHNWSNFEKDYCLLEKDKLLYYLNEYLDSGGFPESFKKNDYTSREILSSLFNDILARDIAMHFSIESDKLKKIAQYLITNTSSEFSYRKIGNNLQIHPSTVEKYISYLEQSFLISTLKLYSYKIQLQFRMQKKIYCVDNGLRNVVSFRNMKERGILLENFIYNELKMREYEIYYWKSSDGEVDFIIANGSIIHHLIQVAWEIEDEHTLTREINGIILGAQNFRMKKGIIFTKSINKKETHGGIEINFIPIELWALGIINF